MALLIPEPKELELRWQEAATVNTYADKGHEPPTCDPPDSWHTFAACDSNDGAWMPYAAGTTSVRWRRLVYRLVDVKTPETKDA